VPVIMSRRICSDPVPSSFFQIFSSHSIRSHVCFADIRNNRDMKTVNRWRKPSANILPPRPRDLFCTVWRISTPAQEIDGTCLGSALIASVVTLEGFRQGLGRISMFMFASKLEAAPKTTAVIYSMCFVAWDCLQLKFGKVYGKVWVQVGSCIAVM
jgi:hypothetical protein